MKTLEPKACGPKAWQQWLISGIRVFSRTSLWIHGFHAFVAYSLYSLVSALPDHNISVFFFVLSVGIFLRPCQEKLSEALYKNEELSMMKQWNAYWSGLEFSTNKYSLSLVVMYAIGGIFIGKSSAFSNFTGYALVVFGLNAAIFVRPFGPLNIYNKLLKKFEIPLLSGFQLQGRALVLNASSFLMLLSIVVLISLGLLFIPLLALLISYPLLHACVMRCAYVDIFEGGIELAELETTKIANPLLQMVPIRIDKK